MRENAIIVFFEKKGLKLFMPYDFIVQNLRDYFYVILVSISVINKRPF